MTLETQENVELVVIRSLRSWGISLCDSGSCPGVGHPQLDTFLGSRTNTTTQTKRRQTQTKMSAFTTPKRSPKRTLNALMETGGKVKITLVFSIISPYWKCVTVCTKHIHVFSNVRVAWFRKDALIYAHQLISHVCYFTSSFSYYNVFYIFLESIFKSIGVFCL